MTPAKLAEGVADARRRDENKTAWVADEVIVETADERDRLMTELDAARRQAADTVESMSRDLIERREEIARLREDLATTEGALALAREGLQCSVDDFNAIKNQNARLVALLSPDEMYDACRADWRTRPCVTPEDMCWEHRCRAILAESKGGG